MRKSKIYKFSIFFLVVIVISSCVIYWQLSNRNKAILKTAFLYKTGIIDNQWTVNNLEKEYKMISPDFYIDL
jgi:hypothetical protein